MGLTYAKCCHCCGTDNVPDGEDIDTELRNRPNNNTEQESKPKQESVSRLLDANYVNNDNLNEFITDDSIIKHDVDQERRFSFKYECNDKGCTAKHVYYDGKAYHV